MCVLIPLQKASAQINLDPVTLTVDGDSEKTTTTTDTDDITFTVNVLYLKDLFGFIDLSTTTTVPEGATLMPTLNPTGLNLTQGSDQDVTITAPRTDLTVAGTYTIVFTANYGFTFPQRPISTTLTITVEGSVVQTYGVTVEVQGSSTQTTTTAGTGDITYTLRVTNTGSGTDLITLTKSDVPTSTLSETLLSSLAANAYEDVTLTVPRSALSSVGTYAVTVTATSDGDVDTVTLSTTSAFLEEDTGQDVILTIPRAALSDVGTYSVTVTATSQDNSAITATVTTNTIITDDPITPTGPTLRPRQTEQTQEVQQTLPEQTTDKVVFSEFMFESEGGENGLPQWIEVYNNSNLPINLRGWELHWKRMQPSLLEVTTTFKEDFTIPVQQSRLIVTSLGRHSEGGKLSDDTVYQLHLLHAEELAQNDIENRNRLSDYTTFTQVNYAVAPPSFEIKVATWINIGELS